VLGITLQEWAQMDAEERQEYMVDALNRAADLLEATADAFDADLGSERSEVKRLAVKLTMLARKFS
jgi:hypothetical protein